MVERNGRRERGEREERWRRRGRRRGGDTIKVDWRQTGEDRVKTKEKKRERVNREGERETEWKRIHPGVPLVATQMSASAIHEGSGCCCWRWLVRRWDCLVPWRWFSQGTV